MSPLFPDDLLDVLAAEKLLAVLTVEDPADAVPLARALVRGGVRVMELAWRTAATLEAMEAIVREVPEMLAGVGTLLSVEQMRLARCAGAAFGVSPGSSPALLAAARDLGFPYAPGVMTPSDLHLAVEHQCRFVKYFPAESAGSVAHLRSMNAPFAHLNMRYIVLGGLTEANASSYLEEPSVAVLGGSWIARGDLIARREWEVISARARQARSVVDAAARPAARPAAASAK